jgi:TIR domain
MRVFLSCSGEMGRNVARALHDWLPKVIQSVKPFISEDIDKGEPWFENIVNELNETDFGIICITSYNFKAPWLNFESGALTKKLRKPFVSPFLFRVEKSKVRGPLEHFQITEYGEGDVFKLVSSINNRLKPEVRLTHELLEEEFKAWWGELRDNLDSIPDSHEVETETGFEWLYTAEDFARKQARINCAEIWVITPDLYRRAIDPKVREIVRKNLERDISYTFITQASGKTNEARRELSHIFSAKSHRLTVKPINEKEFHRLAVTDYVVINPEEDNNHPLYVFLELPIKEQGYWIEVNNEAALDFVERFKRMMKPPKTRKLSH